jgi:glycerol-3-phosphate dehydrogenase (NAD(P)+)
VSLAVLGAGAFGTALADVVATRGEAVHLWCETQEQVDEILATRTNERRLPGVKLHAKIVPTTSLADIARAARLLLLAVPSTRLPDALRPLGDVVDGSHMIVHASGALTADEGKRVSELVRLETPVRRVGVLAGPALARDLAERRPCAVVIASPFDDVVATTRSALLTEGTLRVYGSHDLVGTELSAVLCGSFTVALGLADALGVGTGPRAVLVCRAIAEGTRLCVAAGGNERTFSGLAGLGNLLVRAASASAERSDDYRLGSELAKGPAPRHTEGARAAAVAVKLARRLGVRTPILDAIAGVVFQNVPVKQAAKRLAEIGAEEE